MEHKDAIGKAINAGDFVVHGGTGVLHLVTKLNPKFVQVDGLHNYHGAMLVNVTKCLTDPEDSGTKQQLIDKYGDKVDHSVPQPKKASPRWVVAVLSYYNTPRGNNGDVPHKYEVRIIKVEDSTLSAFSSARDKSVRVSCDKDRYNNGNYISLNHLSRKGVVGMVYDWKKKILTKAEMKKYGVPMQDGAVITLHDLHSLHNFFSGAKVNIYS